MAMSPGSSSSEGPRSSRRFSAQGEINVTPLIDIVLVLLIVFMVMTPVTLKELVAKVPEAAAENQPQPPGENPIIVELGADDHLTVGGEPVTPEALAACIGERLARDRRKVVFFRIDDRANYGRAVRIMDTCKGAGARILAILSEDSKTR
jgi:biopolymer transport protein TolR